MIHASTGGDADLWKDGEIVALHVDAFDADRRAGWSVSVPEPHGKPRTSSEPERSRVRPGHRRRKRHRLIHRPHLWPTVRTGDRRELDRSRSTRRAAAGSGCDAETNERIENWPRPIPLHERAPPHSPQLRPVPALLAPREPRPRNQAQCVLIEPRWFGGRAASSRGPCPSAAEGLARSARTRDEWPSARRTVVAPMTLPSR